MSVSSDEPSLERGSFVRPDGSAGSESSSAPSPPSAGAPVPSLPATAWAVLGTLSFGEGLSGYDIKTWADWSLNYFYWSPSFSQVYSELKRLEKHGFVESRRGANEVRNRRVYTITGAGLAALRRWAHESEVDRPVLKHPTMLHLWVGHMSSPEQLREIVRGHIDQMVELRDGAAARAEGAKREPAWAYTHMVLEWSRKHYQAEIDLAEELIDGIDGIDAATQRFESVDVEQGTGLPIPVAPGWWKRNIR